MLQTRSCCNKGTERDILSLFGKQQVKNRQSCSIKTQMPLDFSYNHSNRYITATVKETWRL